MEDLSLLQQNVLEKYKKLAQVLHSLDETFKKFNSSDHSDVSPESILQQIRDIEIKIAQIGTLLKGSVYSLILQRRQQIKGSSG
ncbi:hypothetical protein HG535_0B03040 [Zygotorulaspora mrakii]|uniref:DASH complex subunit DAD3 n=1 Tax=Zygotorulaspora mrakii TaxID=42260 RepID=A0A7H9AXZ9_ZYGMR|nr:uncharacterized protein HG535_0B03040 [Zygotorulaspora mrakii]QLG71265.1 hypothetical protein HG535_0B03040 [Zygotorulaspora mrakii]